MPEPIAPRKPPSRFWLYAPYGLFAAAILAWSLVWLWISHQTADRMDEAARRLRAQGWRIHWAQRQIGGYPFRLNVRLADAVLIEPSGWGVTAPAVQAEAYAFAPSHWVALADQGVQIQRPAGGPVTVTGQAMRLRLNPIPGQALPQAALEGWKLNFATAAGGRPYAVSAADHAALYLPPQARDGGEFQLQLTTATPTAGGLLARLSAARPLSLVWDETLTHASALAGRDWPSAVRAWSRAGGELSLAHGEIDAGQVTLTAQSGRLSVNDNGQLTGAMTLDLSHAHEVPARLAAPAPTPAAAPPLAQAPLSLEAGRMSLGPFEIGPAPRAF